MKVNFLHIAFLLLVSAVSAAAQPKGYVISAKNAEHLAGEAALRDHVAFLTDSLCAGRATGTLGSTWAISAIGQEFKSSGLLPADGSYYRGFRTDAGRTAHNVVGFLPGSGPKYVVVAAHFDHLGTLSGTVYPGADSNASGVAAMLTMARMFRHLQNLGKTYAHTLIFVALDAKEQSLGGSRQLWREIENGLLRDPKTGRAVLPEDIDRMVNIDQVGGTEAPIHRNRPDYLIMLSEPADGRRDILHIANMTPGIGLDLDFSYYGSKDFTRLFYRSISDQKPFLEAGIPSVMFTSGITFRNNKPEDTADSLDYAVLRRRVLAIFHYLARVV
jgi:Zn-dependent M28 family amino/carboxypeptidase